MAYIKKEQNHAIGDEVLTTKEHESLTGLFEKFTLVTVIEITDRGYTIADKEGNTISEIGWII